MRITGKMSTFGGPLDGAPDEGLAFIYEVSDKPELFLPRQPPGTTGLARRLDPDKFYLACRWNYDEPNQSKTELLEHKALVRAESGRQFLASPADWGPAEHTGRIADLSPGLAEALQIETDDIVSIVYPASTEIVEQPPPWTPRARVGVALTIPDGVQLVLDINGVRLMPEDDVD